MEEKELQELEEFTLEDIIKEFSDYPQEEVQEEAPVAEEPVEAPAEEVVEELILEETPAEEIPVEEAATEELAPVQEEEIPEEMPAEEVVEELEEVPAQEPAVTTDTIRLDSSELLKGAVYNAKPIDDEEEEAQAIPQEEEKPAFTEEWEPEYEQPMGEYVPPQPIAFPARNSTRETKRKLILGPEKRYYELTEKGLGGVQVSMFFCLLVALASAASTVMYAQGFVPDNRLRLMIFVQFLAVLVSGLLGSHQMIQGVGDLFKGRFTLNTLLVVSFLACLGDGVFCLLQERIPCCAAFSLEVLLSLWATYNRRHAELGQMDVLRKASRLYGISAKENAYEDGAVLLRTPAQVEHFMDNYDQVTKPQKTQNRYALIALLFSLAIGVFAGLTKDWYMGLQMTAVSLLAAIPATSFIATTRPFAILQRRLHRLGAVLCGWQGVEQLSGKAVFPVESEDLFPVGSTRMNGVKFFGDRPTDMVVAYATALIVAEGSGLAPVFTQVLDSRNGRHYDAQDVRRYDGGGIGGLVLDEPVLVGPLSFLKEMGVEVPEGIQVSQAVCVAIDGELCGVFAISYEKTRSATAGLSTLSSYRNLSAVVVAGEFMLAESFIRGKFGIKSKRLRFLKEEERQVLRQVTAEEDAQTALITTLEGLAPMAYGVTGARALRSACNFGVVLNMIGGILGMAVVLVLMILGFMELLTPVNMFLYQLVWMIPGLLLTEWTRSV